MKIHQIHQITKIPHHSKQREPCKGIHSTINRAGEVVSGLVSYLQDFMLRASKGRYKCKRSGADSFWVVLPVDPCKGELVPDTPEYQKTSSQKASPVWAAPPIRNQLRQGKACQFSSLLPPIPLPVSCTWALAPHPAFHHPAASHTLPGLLHL
jgi:hypothetical protein